MKRIGWLLGSLSLALVVVPAAAIAIVWFALPLDGTTLTVVPDRKSVV